MEVSGQNPILAVLQAGRNSSVPTGYRGRDSPVGIATGLRAGRSGDRIPVGARFSAPVQTGPGGHVASHAMGTGSPSPSNAEVEVRVELYFWSFSGPSWSVLGWPLPLPTGYEGSWDSESIMMSEICLIFLFGTHESSIQGVHVPCK